MDAKEDKEMSAKTMGDDAVPSSSATETDGEPEEQETAAVDLKEKESGMPSPAPENVGAQSPPSAGGQGGQRQMLMAPQQQPITIIVQQQPDSLDLKRYRGLFVTLIVFSVLSFLLCWTQYFICALTSILGVVAGAMGISPHQCCCNNTQKTHVTHIRGLLISTAFFSGLLMCLAIILGIILLINSNNYYWDDPTLVVIGNLVFNRTFVIVTGSLNMLNAVFLLTMMVICSKLSCDIPPTDEQCCGETPDAPAMDRYYYPPQQQMQQPQIIVLGGGGNVPPQFQQQQYAYAPPQAGPQQQQQQPIMQQQPSQQVVQRQ